MKTTYTLKKDVDGKLWVTVHELMVDIKDALDKITKLEHTNLEEVDIKELNAKIVGLHAIYTFLGALVTEQTLIDKKSELDQQQLVGNITISDLPIDTNLKQTETLH